MKLPLHLINLLIVIFALPVFIFSSCKKHSPIAAELTSDATVIDGGNPLADGCGWEMKINATDSLYSLPNLPVSFQTGNLKVRITYHKLTTRYYCGTAEIQLDAITKQ